MKYIQCKSKFIIIFFLYFIYFIPKENIKKFFHYFKVLSKERTVGVINLPNFQNVGNILVKYSMFKILNEFGFNATIISPILRSLEWKSDMSFINRTIKDHSIEVSENFSELNERNFDYLIVNSDQTWGFYWEKYFYNVALLKFAENWTVHKFMYATSMGSYDWYFKKEDEIVFKKLLKNFSGISFREKGTVKIVEDHLGLKSVFVLDPTLLLDKQYYLNEIKNYNSDFLPKDKFIFVYQLDKNPVLEKTIKIASEKLNMTIYKLILKKSNYIENFLLSIYKSQAVIVDSFHGTIFSIIFNKPFISFSNKLRGKARFDSLKELFNLNDRIIESDGYSHININLLLEPLNINKTEFNKLKEFSINYLKKNLDLI